MSVPAAMLEPMFEDLSVREVETELVGMAGHLPAH